MNESWCRLGIEIMRDLRFGLLGNAAGKWGTRIEGVLSILGYECWRPP